MSDDANSTFSGNLDELFARVRSLATNPILVECWSEGDIEWGLAAAAKFESDGEAPGEEDLKKLIGMSDAWARNVSEWESRPTAFVQVLLNDHAGLKQSLKAYPVDQPDSQGMTLLMTAAMLGKTEAISILLQKGADVGRQIEAGARAGQDALFLAFTKLQTDAAKALVDAGAPLDRPYMAGKSLLNLAALSGVVNLVQMLLGAGASLDLADQEGWTPLISAASRARLMTLPSERHLQICRELIEAGADVTIEADDRTTALGQLCDARGGLLGANRLGGLFSLFGQRRAPSEFDEQREVGLQQILVLARMVLERGATPDESHPTEDMTILEWAEEQGDDALVELLNEFIGE